MVLREFQICFSYPISFIDFQLEIPPKQESECSHTKKNKQYPGVFQII